MVEARGGARDGISGSLDLGTTINRLSKVYNTEYWYGIVHIVHCNIKYDFLYATCQVWLGLVSAEDTH